MITEDQIRHYLKETLEIYKNSELPGEMGLDPKELSIGLATVEVVHPRFGVVDQIRLLSGDSTLEGESSALVSPAIFSTGKLSDQPQEAGS